MLLVFHFLLSLSTLVLCVGDDSGVCILTSAVPRKDLLEVFPPRRKDADVDNSSLGESKEGCLLYERVKLGESYGSSNVAISKDLVLGLSEGVASLELETMLDDSSAARASCCQLPVARKRKA
jgi:hypothetical protein